MAVGAPVGNGVPEPESARLQTERVLASEIFRDSPIQQRLLRFLVDQSLAGVALDLKEYTIGSAVFGRRDDFDPRTDSIVRVQVGVLRKKLAAYYAGPGAADEYVVEVPRGHYTPQFTLRKSHPVIAVPPVRRRPAWVYLMAGILAGGLASYLATRLLAPAPQSNASRASEWRKHPLWKGFFEPGLPVKLVIGAPFLLDFNGLLVRDTSVNTPEGIAGSAAVRYLESRTQAKPVPVEVYTGMGEAEGASLLTRFFDHAGVDLPLIRSRHTKWQDLNAGNLIFLASLRFRTLGRELDRPSDFQFVTAPGQPSLLRNLRPQTGEAETYQFSMTSRSSGGDYALVTVWPGTFPGRRVMAIGGSTTWGTAAAVAYITDGLSLRELWDRIGTTEPAGKTGLQILLKIDIKDNQAASTTYLTSHWLP
jgi:hypothetical protein